MSSVVHSAASSKCAARSPRTAAQFFEAKKVSLDPVAIQTPVITQTGAASRRSSRSNLSSTPSERLDQHT